MRLRCWPHLGGGPVSQAICMALTIHFWIAWRSSRACSTRLTSSEATAWNAAPRTASVSASRLPIQFSHLTPRPAPTERLSSLCATLPWLGAKDLGAEREAGIPVQDIPRHGPQVYCRSKRTLARQYAPGRQPGPGFLLSAWSGTAPAVAPMPMRPASPVSKGPIQPAEAVVWRHEMQPHLSRLRPRHPHWELGNWPPPAPLRPASSAHSMPALAEPHSATSNVAGNHMPGPGVPACQHRTASWPPAKLGRSTSDG